MKQGSRITQKTISKTSFPTINGLPKKIATLLYKIRKAEMA